MHTRRRFITQSCAATAAAVSFARPSLATNTRLSPEQTAAHLLNRLGFGPRPGDLAAVAANPQAWLTQQLTPAQLPLPASLTGKLNEARFLQTHPIDALREFTDLLRDNQVAASIETPSNRNPMAPVGAFVNGFQGPAVQSRLLRALESPRQLEEVMVDFWFNHFNLFHGKNLLRVMMGHYEHFAIRPHAMGRFRDLLGATAHHPAMLFYLDNSTSVANAANGRRGLNENYARELMELHTLGVDAGYQQSDVTELARILTGWTHEQVRRPNANIEWPTNRGTGMPGFVFNRNTHDSGEKLWMGHRIAPNGKAEGDFALDVLAKHPATARHISFKLAQYFVSDQPPARLVEQLAKVFLEQDGQIAPVLKALFASDAFWATETIGVKFKSPYHYVLSCLRASAASVQNVQGISASLTAQGMPLYGCPTPDGYKNTESAWLNPDGMTKRINFAAQLANGRLGGQALTGLLDATGLLRELGPLVTPATRQLLTQHTNDPVLASTLLLASPGMMRR